MKKIFLINLIFLIFTLKLWGNDINKGIKEFERGNYNKALNIFLNVSPSFKIRNFYIAKCYFKLKKYRKALLYYKKVAKNKKIAYLVYNDMGLIYQKLNDTERALMFLLKSIKLKNNFFLSHYNLANLYLFLKKYNMAIEEYQKTLSYTGNYDKKFLSNVFLGIGNCYQYLNDVTKAIENYQLSLKYNKNNIKTYYNLAFLYYNNKYYDEAIKMFNKILRYSTKNKINKNIYFYIGNSYRILKEYKNMEKYYKKMLKLNPYHKDTLYSLASYYALINNKKNMLKYLKMLFSVDKEYKRIILHNNIFKKYQNDNDFKEIIK